MRHRHADGARPNRGVVHNEAGHEVFIFAGRYPVFRRARITTPLPLQRGPLGMPNPYKGGAEQKPA
jgi:hypothetical protein